YESVVQQRDALEKKLADVLAENTKMRNAIEFATAPDMWIEQHNAMLEYRYVDWYVDVLNEAKETPVTDEFTREMMAKGVESGAEHFRSRARCARGLGHHDRACFLDTTAEMFDEYAESLRKGINDAQ
uniref:hypothetical protein n=1 Tax=Hafnia paralvei TaxID=546367 RepID=UPI00241C9821